MKIIHITVIVQVFIAIVSLVHYIIIKNYKGEIMYCHGKKSFVDTYKMMAIYPWFNVLVIYWAAFLKLTVVDQSVILSVLVKWFIHGTIIVVLMMTTLLVAITLYMTTEVKHLSPGDGVGKNLRDSKNKKEKRNAYRFYALEAIEGFLIDVTLIIQTFHLHILIGIVFVLISIFLYYFGMADVLQHDNYNSKDYSIVYKKKSLADRFFIKNLVRFYKDRDYHVKSVSALKENTENIKIGIRILIKNFK